MELIRELAEHHDAIADVTTNEAVLADALFGDSPVAYALVADDDHEIVGCAIWSLPYAVWRGRQYVWLSDLYVREPFRRRGHARELIDALARICKQHNYHRIEWRVSQDNQSAEPFYEAIGAVGQEDWRLWQLKDDALEARAE